MRKFYSISLVLLVVLLPGIKAQTISIKGVVKDKKSGNPLPYTSIVVKGAFRGTISGPNGNFILFIPDSLINDTLQINHLGFKTFEKPINKIANAHIDVKLKPIATEIEAVIIKPFTAEEQLRMAIRDIDNNYPQEPFKTEGFYLEELLENDIYIKFAEAFVEIYSPPFGDTNQCQAKLIQARTKDSLGQIKFLEAFIQKKYEKDKRKADRKGDTLNPEDYNNGIQVMFGGPKSALTTDFVRGKSMFLDTSNFKKFDFTYEKDNSLAGKDLIVIRCRNKKAIDHLFMDALVYIDKETNAFVKITTTNTVKIPAIAKPILSLYRMKIGVITFNVDNEYRNVNESWYPSKVLLTFGGEATKKYKKGKFEHGVFRGSQAFAATNIQTKSVEEFNEEERMTDDEIAEQMGEYNPDFWGNRTKIEYSVK